MRTEKQITANRLNALKSHGPANTKLTRTNATKHGLLAAGITELDDEDLEKETNPVGTIEIVLVESIAVEIVRLRRARRLEGEHINGALNPSLGLRARMRLDSIHPLVKRFPAVRRRRFYQRLFRILHELERLNRMRQGEQLPAPAALDVSVHHDTGMQSDTMPLPQEETLGDMQDDAINHATFPEPETEAPGDKEDTEIKRVNIPEPETEILGDPEVR